MSKEKTTENVEILEPEVVVPENKIVSLSGQQIDLTKYKPEQIEKSKEISKVLNPKDTNSVLNYGIELQTKLNSFSGEILNNVRNIDTGTIGDTITELLQEIDYVDPANDKHPIMRVLESLPIIKDLIKSTKKIMTRYDKVSGNLDNIILKMDKNRISLLKDNTVLDHMFQKNLEFVDDLNVYILAAQMRVDELDREIHEMEVTGNFDKFELSEAKNFSDRLKKKLMDLQLTKTVTVQSLPQIRVIQGNNAVLVDKMQSTILNTIPLWRNQVCMTLTLDKQRKVVEMENKVEQTTNELLRKNSERLKQNSIEIARMNERTIIDVDVIKQVNNDLITTLDEIMKIKNEGDINRAKVAKELESIEKELKAKILDVKSLSTDQEKAMNI